MKRTFLMGTLIAVSALMAGAQSTSTGTVTGPNGKSATRSTTRGGGNVNSTVTGPNGKSANRSVARSAGSASATVTGPNGKSATRTRTTTR